MPDRKPPRLEGDEGDTLRALLQYQRDSLVRKASGVDEAAARRSLVGSGTTMLWLIKHVARAESLWIQRRFAGEELNLPDDTVHPDDTLAAALEAYRTTWTRTDSIVASASSLDESCRDVGDEAPVNLRWVLMHLLEETARHAGHADILRELIDGSTGR
ncbi:MAG TPA: DinB family protein [Acidimicrobiales bacterium]|nr:DinB family protein [Acidimicrobiales bacterium]HLN42037.1 DinB family protein [Acidimicrobiales bacterium]